MDKIKRLFSKEFLLNHGEKVIFGLIALAGLGIIFSANWETEKRTPQDLLSLVDTAKTNLSTSVWTEKDDAKFKLVVDLDQQARQMLVAKQDSGDYGFTASNTFWLNKKQEKIREPEWLPVEQVLASVDRVILTMPPKNAPLNPDDPLAQTNPEGVNPLDPLAPTEPNATNPDGGPMFKPKNPGTGLPGTTLPGDPMTMPPEMTTIPNYSNPMDPMMMSPEMMGGTALTKIATMSGRGERVVAIRGVFPLKKQIEKIALASNIPASEVEAMLIQRIQQMTQQSQMNQNSENPMGPMNPMGMPPFAQPNYSPEMSESGSTYAAASSHGAVNILNFEIERQTAQPGADPWSGPWVKVDIELALKILSEVLDFDPDPVDVSVTDTVITSPLPGRVAQPWGELATHPLVRDFVLPPDELEKVNALNAQIRAQWEQANRNMPRPPEKKGFGGLQYNMNQMRSEMFNQSAENSGRFMTGINSLMNPNTTAVNGQNDLASKIKRRMSASGYYLLFRYFDFGVTPGNAYRYRVRLELTNPNYNRSREEVLTPDIADGQTRMTEWSKPTATVVIPQDSNYFLTRVEYPVSTTAEPSARLNLFHWFPEVGTTVNTIVNAHLGALIGGPMKAEVLDPAEQTFEAEDIVLDSQDLLVDISEVPLLTQEQHPDLGLGSKSRLRGQLGLNEPALVVDQFGEMRSLDPVSQKATEAQYASVYNAWATHFEDLKQKEEAPMEGSELTTQEQMMEMYSSGRTANPNRKRGRGNMANMP